MFITCIHVAVIVLALLPSVLTVWQKDKARCFWHFVLSVTSSPVVTEQIDILRGTIFLLCKSPF